MAWDLWLLKQPLVHHPSPLKVAKNSDDDIEPIERSLERDVLVEIQPAGDHIHHNPYKPLLQVLTGQGPDAYDAKGSSKGIKYRNIGVGEAYQDEINDGPDHGGEAEPEEGQMLGNMTDGEAFGFLLVAHPSDEAIDGHG